jgi:hypothetical protein
MGNETSAQLGARSGEEAALLRAVLGSDVAGLQAALQQKPAAIYAHSKDGENIWHAAAQGGHAEVITAAGTVWAPAQQHMARTCQRARPCLVCVTACCV